MVVGGSFDAGGFLVAFVVSVSLIALFIFLYLRERNSRQRPYYLLRYRYGVLGAVFLTLVTGLRRFVLHQ